MTVPSIFLGCRKPLPALKNADWPHFYNLHQGKEEPGQADSGKNMDKAIKDLYYATLQERADGDKLNSSMKEEILKLLREEEKLLEKQKYEEYRDKVFRVASIAEEAGFIRGVKYAFRLFAECLQE